MEFVNFYDAGHDGEMAAIFPEYTVEEYDVDNVDHDATVYLPEFIVEVNFYYAEYDGEMVDTFSE